MQTSKGIKTNNLTMPVDKNTSMVLKERQV
jgi:hypothetical protein